MRQLVAFLLLCTLLVPDAALLAQTSAGLPAPVVETIANDQVLVLPPEAKAPIEKVFIEDVEVAVRANMTLPEAEELKKNLFAYAKKTRSLIAYTKLRMLEHRFPANMVAQKSSYSSQSYQTYAPYHSRNLQPTSQTIGGNTDLFSQYFGLSEGAKQEIDLLTGVQAGNETLQLGSIAPRRPEALDGAETIPLSTITPLEIRSHPWAEMRAGKLEPTIPAIFDRVPSDAFVVYFSSASRAKDLEGALASLGKSGAAIFDLDAALSLSAQIGQRLGITDLERRLSEDFALAEMAFVSEDLDFVRGTEFALILRPKEGVSPETLAAFAGKEKAHTSIVGGMVVLATSQRYLEKITGPGMRPMSREQDLAYMLSVLETKRDGFAFFSEAFIRMLTGPTYRTAAARRSVAFAKIESLQYMALAYHSIAGTWPKNFSEIAENGYADPAEMQKLDQSYAVGGEGVVSSAIWGTLAAPKSVGDVPVVMLTDGEEKRYESFRNGYEQLWREFIDPIGAAFHVDDHLTFHTVILPLIEESDYNFAKGLFGKTSAKASFDGVIAPARTTPILALARLNVDRYLLDNDALIREALREEGRMALSPERVQTYTLRGAITDALTKRSTTAQSCLSGVFADPPVAGEMKNISSVMGTNASCFASGSDWALSWPVASTTMHVCLDAKHSWGWTYVRENVTSSACPSPEITGTEREKALMSAVRVIWDGYTLDEKKTIINRALNGSLEDLKLSTPLDAFGLIGSEAQFGIGESLPFEIENIADYDGYVGIKLADKERFKRYLDEVFRAFAEEMGVGSGGYGFFALSSKEPLKNLYGGIEYYVIPTGFVNLYYLFHGDYVYFFISQLGVNNMIAGLTATSTKPALTPLQSRARADIGDGPDIMALADLGPLAEFRRQAVEGENMWGGYVLSTRAKQTLGFLSDYQWTMRMLGTANAKETFFRRAPESFQGVPISVTSSGIRFHENGPRFEDVDFGGASSGLMAMYGISASSETRATGTVKFSSVVTAEDKARILADLEKFEGFGVGLAFTADGLDVRLSIKNPLGAPKPVSPALCEGEGCATWFDGLSKQVVNIGFGLLALFLLGGAGFAVWRIRRARSLGSELAAPAAISNLGSTLDAPAAIVQSDMHTDAKSAPATPPAPLMQATLPPVAPTQAAPLALSIPPKSDIADVPALPKPTPQAVTLDPVLPFLPPLTKNPIAPPASPVPLPAPVSPVPVPAPLPPSPATNAPSLTSMLSGSSKPSASAPSTGDTPVPPRSPVPQAQAAKIDPSPKQAPAARSSFLANLISATKLPSKDEIQPPAPQDLLPQLPMIAVERPSHDDHPEPATVPEVHAAPVRAKTLPPDLFAAPVAPQALRGMPPARIMSPRPELPSVPVVQPKIEMPPLSPLQEVKTDVAPASSAQATPPPVPPLAPASPAPAAANDFDDMFIPIPEDLRNAVTKGGETPAP